MLKKYKPNNDHKRLTPNFFLLHYDLTICTVSIISQYEIIKFDKYCLRFEVIAMKIIDNTIT